MRYVSLWVGVGALALVVVIGAACSGASSQEPKPTRLGASAGPAEPQTVEGALFNVPTPMPEAEVVYVGPIDVRAVALTFDTGVQAGHVPEILDVLKKHKVHATFGITGHWAVTNPDLLKRIVKEGHALINHSWSHPSFTGEDTGTQPLTAKQIRSQLARTEKKVREIASASTKPYFRPPYGDFDPFVNRVAREEGYKYNVLWMLDSLGWAGRSTNSVVAVTLASAFNGVIYLYHVDNPWEYKALGKIIKGLRERGLMMVTIPQLLGKKPMPTPTPTPTPTPIPKPTPTPTPTRATVRSSPPKPAPPLGPTPTPKPAPAQTPTPPRVPKSTPTATPSPMPTPTMTPTPSPTPTPTPTPEP